MTLTRIVAWSHTLAREILQPGELAVDLTAGKGRDTLMLAAEVGLAGRVIAFDIQPQALAATARTLRAKGWQPASLTADERLPAGPGIFLTHGCHSNLSQLVPGGVKVVMANLGYLPGGDPATVTSARTTHAALEQSLKILIPGGRLIVTVYPGHPGGHEEEAAVNQLLTGLPSMDWQVLQMRVVNHVGAPVVFAAEKKS